MASMKLHEYTDGTFGPPAAYAAYEKAWNTALNTAPGSPEHEAAQAKMKDLLRDPRPAPRKNPRAEKG